MLGGDWRGRLRADGSGRPGCTPTAAAGLGARRRQRPGERDLLAL